MTDLGEQGKTDKANKMDGTARGKKSLGIGTRTPKQSGAVIKVRRNKRSDGTIQSILSATEEILLRSGAERISILDVCEEAHISRGTFYRYFSSQEDLLDAYSRYKRDQFHTSLHDATDAYVDPDERLQAVVRYIDNYLENTRARQLLVVAPDYALRFFQRIFQDSVVRFQDVLRTVFDAWEERFGVQLDREMICELMIRYILSEVLVPSGPERRNVPRKIGRMISMLMSGKVARR
ncbi:MAG: TetR/AcrR family transcriptional regulator [Betaproteobacteria bacterium HGW-Betaproteobacteria-18]|jgi:AcrR family transcriptional regulator|nr:MAG: TetR/AcrR family transcriptional regulator [Betaproteobacteria bacterium HGW-Betaproteobacteria-5]PKO40593.1 MAG: TetR/AcrR family transcriptional regulator [Betaproteobacteria bacterium HGW-Betaproteobacteria-6]PKO63056.1 MAG: TetR/AcrR family transcriptional regulator [Betaproteobacteria bacterium HGW-Betaproteobacteria-18]